MITKKINDWYDELFWVVIDFSISIVNSGTVFSWDTIDLIDTKPEGEYHYNKYKSGLIGEGMRVNMIVKIVSTEDDWKLEIDTMKIMELISNKNRAMAVMVIAICVAFVITSVFIRLFGGAFSFFPSGLKQKNSNLAIRRFENNLFAPLILILWFI